MFRFWGAIGFMSYMHDRIRKHVCFVGVRSNPDGPVAFVGTAFFLAYSIGNGASQAYAVTARHVLEAIRSRSCDQCAYLRVNLFGGGTSEVQFPLSNWVHHPQDDTTDVAVIPLVISSDWDHDSFLVSGLATRPVIADWDFNLGEEVYPVGLFKHRSGEGRNIPIVRVGNLAGMPEEPVVSKKWGRIHPCYLIESRSIRGLSGSPVFMFAEDLHWDWLNVPGGVKFTTNMKIGDRTFPSKSHALFILGLMHGHWDAHDCDLSEDAHGLDERAVNMGIAIVVAAESIIEVLDQPLLRQQREQRLAEPESQQISYPDRTE